MEIAIVVALILAGLAFFFWTENRNLHERIVTLDSELTEAKHRKRTSPDTKSKSAEPKVDDSESARELDEAKSEIKDLKKQVYDLKQEGKDLRKQVKEGGEEQRPSVPDSDVVFSLREEIADLKAEVSRLETEAKSASRAPKQEKPAEPAPREEPKTAATGDADLDALRAKYEKELQGLREELRTETKDLQRKLKSTSRNVDKQRRRADNNDRAYKITQRQFDAAQERVDYLEAQLKKAGFAVQAESAGEAAQAEEPAKSEAPPKAQVVKKAAAPKPKESAKPEETAKPKEPAKPEETAKPEEPKVAPTEKAPAVAAAEVADQESEADDSGKTTVFSGAALETPDEAGEEESEAEESGHTTVMSGAAFAADDSDRAGDTSPPRSADEPAQPEASVQTQPEVDNAIVTESTLKSKPVTDQDIAEATAAIASERSDAADDSDDAGDAGNTEVLSPAALGAAFNPPTGEQEAHADSASEQGAVDQTEADEVSAASGAPGKEVNEDSQGGRRPSAGLFGIPDNVLNGGGEKGDEEEQDSIRSTQFAFPAKLVGDADPDEDDETAKEDQEGDATKTVDNRLGGGRLGDNRSSVDDAWADIDVD